MTVSAARPRPCCAQWPTARARWVVPGPGQARAGRLPGLYGPSPTRGRSARGQAGTRTTYLEHGEHSVG
jgi:hypothetical protein